MNKIEILKNSLEKYYDLHAKDLLFHWWHHIMFVWKKSILFAEELNANSTLVQAAALTHDLNYAVKKNSTPKDGEELRSQFLRDAWFNESEIDTINHIIIEEEISSRDHNISLEAKALSDADTLFKVLPITPIIFSSKYIQENDTDIKKLANKIVTEQENLLIQWIYFYSEYAKTHYLPWAETNINLWKNVVNAYEDEDICEMLEIAKKNHAI